MSEIRSQATPARDSQEMRRLALQSTAEIWRGLDVLDRELRAGQFTSARGTVRAVRELVKMADTLVIAVTEHSLKLEKPRMVTSAAELDALPNMTVVMDNCDDVSQKRGGQWCGYETADLTSKQIAKYGPLTVFFTPGDAG